jgi:hypothetical protein
MAKDTGCLATSRLTLPVMINRKKSNRVMPKSNGSVGKLKPTLKFGSCRVILRGVSATTESINQSRRTKANHTTAKAFDWYHPFTKQHYRVRFASDNLQGEYFEHPAALGPLYKLSFALRQVL